MKLEAIANVKIFEEVILKGAQKKINERLSHKQMQAVLESRIGSDLAMYVFHTIQDIKKKEIYHLRKALFNTQLGLGNMEMKKLAKNSDQVVMMRNIINA